MAKKIAGVTVLQGTRVKWGTIGALFLGVPVYAVTYGYVRFTQLVYGFLEYVTLGPFSFVSQLIETAFSDAYWGIVWGNASFVTAVQGSGLLGAIFGAVGTIVVTFAVYRGVLLLNG